MAKKEDINKAYIDDIFDDVQITVDGTNDYAAGRSKDFTKYWQRAKNGD